MKSIVQQVFTTESRSPAHLSHSFSSWTFVLLPLFQCSPLPPNLCSEHALKMLSRQQELEHWSTTHQLHVEETGDIFSKPWIFLQLWKFLSMDQAPADWPLQISSPFPLTQSACPTEHALPDFTRNYDHLLQHIVTDWIPSTLHHHVSTPRLCNPCITMTF